MLGFVADISLEEGLRLLWSWHHEVAADRQRRFHDDDNPAREDDVDDSDHKALFR